MKTTIYQGQPNNEYNFNNFAQTMKDRGARPQMQDPKINYQLWAYELSAPDYCKIEYRANGLDEVMVSLELNTNDSTLKKY